MITILLRIAGWFVGLLLNKQPAPASISQVQEKIDAVQIKASTAGDDAARAIDSADKLRNYESSDPNNRDNG